MAHLLRSLASVFVFVVTFAVGAAAQVPKVGDFFEEKGDLGFRVKTPDDWDLIPPQPGEQNLIAKFTPKLNKYVSTGNGPQDRVFLACWVLKFDRRPTNEPAKGAARFNKPEKNVLDWIKKTGEVENGDKFKLLEGEQDEFTVNKIPATAYQLAFGGDPKTSHRVFAAQYKLSPDLDIAIVFNGPGDPKKWPKWEAPFSQMARSFSARELKATGIDVVGADAPLRDRERARIQKELSSIPSWKLWETPNYFIVTDHTDKAFMAELMARLEAIRAQYEIDYPAAKAEEYRKAGESLKSGGGKTELTDEEKQAKREDDAQKKMMREIFGDADPRELSRCSIVRIFTDSGKYRDYGGPPGSAGYWSPMHRELVLYDDKAGGGRNDTWIVLNHEAFHQYIFYFYGNISPQSWYNEGTGDFYSGLEFKNKRFTLQPNLWRRDTIKAAIQAGEHIPLKDFVRMTQAEYYGANKWGVDGGQNYAQGWALIYFLRTGKKANARGWNPAWDGILETYLKSLAMSGNVDTAVEQAFFGVDFDALETAWKDYTK